MCERNIGRLPFARPCARSLAGNPSMCPDYESNPETFGLRRTPNPWSHTSQGEELNFCLQLINVGGLGPAAWAAGRTLIMLVLKAGKDPKEQGFKMQA